MVQKIVHSLRLFRYWHRWLGLFLLTFILISAITGILLAWKKEADLLQPPTQESSFIESEKPWLSVEKICEIAQEVIVQNNPNQPLAIDRLDIRPDKGIVKVLFASYWEVQVDGYSGEVFSIAKRHSDWIEKIHDGSIISEGFKLWSMNTLGIGLILLSLTGIWLWLGPKRVRELKRQHKSTV
jgi:uncharacterized iron-regulated membrane protein